MIVSSKFSRWQWLFMETTFHEKIFSWNRYFMKMTFQGQSDSGRGSSMLSGEEGNRQPNGQLQVSRWQLIVLKLQLCFFSMAIKKKIKNYEQNGGLRSYASSRDILDLYGQVTIVNGQRQKPIFQTHTVQSSKQKLCMKNISVLGRCQRVILHMAYHH